MAMTTPINGTLLERTRDMRAKTGKRGHSRVTRYKAINIDGTYWYPNSMVALLLLPPKSRKNVKKVAQSRRHIQFWISRCNNMKQAFRRIDGHWFTTPKLFRKCYKKGHSEAKPFRFHRIIEV